MITGHPATLPCLTLFKLEFMTPSYLRIQVVTVLTMAIKTHLARSSYRTLYLEINDVGDDVSLLYLSCTTVDLEANSWTEPIDNIDSIISETQMIKCLKR